MKFLDRFRAKKEHKNFAKVVSRLRDVQGEIDDLVFVLTDTPEYAGHLHEQVPMFYERLHHNFVSLLSALSVSQQDWINQKIKEKVNELEKEKGPVS